MNDSGLAEARWIEVTMEMERAADEMRAAGEALRDYAMSQPWDKDEWARLAYENGVATGRFLALADKIIRGDAS